MEGTNAADSPKNFSPVSRGVNKYQSLPNLKPVKTDHTKAPPVRSASMTNQKYVKREPIQYIRNQKEDLKAEKKRLKKAVTKAKSEAFGKGAGDINQRMQAAKRFLSLKEDLQVTSEAYTKAKKEGANKVQRLMISSKNFLEAVKDSMAQLRPSAKLMGSNSDRAAVVVDIIGTIFGDTQAHHGLLGFKGAANLMREAQGRIDEAGLPEEEAQALKEGIAELKAFRDRCYVIEDTQRAAQTGAIVTYASAHTLTTGAHLGTMGIGGAALGCAVGSVGFLLVAPAAAGLAIDGLVGIARNLRGAKRDQRKLEHKLEANYDLAKRRLQNLDAIVTKLVDRDEELADQVISINNEVKRAQKLISHCDQKLIDGNLSKKEIIELRHQRQEAQSLIGASFKDTTDLLKDRPDLEEIYSLAKGKEVLLSSVTNQQEVLGKYLKQKLKGKQINEFIRAGGQAMNLAGLAITAVGAVQTLAAGAGVPLLIGGTIISLGGLAVGSGLGPLVEGLRNKRLGKDRVDVTQFKETLVQQLKLEAENWDHIPEEMRGQTTTQTMFDLLQNNYAQATWTANDWASGLINDRPNGPYLQDLDRAMNLMLNHDYSKGVVGTVTKYVTQRVLTRIAG